MSLLVLRSILLLIAAGLGASFAEQWDDLYNPWLTFGAVMLVAVLVIATDWLVRRKSLDIVSSVYFGSIVGVFLSYVLRLALDPFMARFFPNVRQGVETLLAAVLVYACISLLLQTRNDFRFIIPYVEFAREVKGQHPFLLDTSVIIDGRIADLAESRIFDSPLIAPQFVVNELQSIADSSDRLKRNRGRRGLDILNRLRSTPDLEFRVLDEEPSPAQQPVDLKLVLLAKQLAGKIITNDYNLNKVAKLHGVSVVNLNELSNALKSAFLPGEELGLKVLRAGEEPGQGVGFLDDGTMVVVEGGRDHVNKQIHVTVTKVLQTSAGRMIFAKAERMTG